MDDRKLLLTERDCCERLGIGRSTLRKLMADGEVRAVHIGRAIRFPAEEIEGFVRRLREEQEEGR